MAPDSFHQFPFLPFEIRRIIYLMASPPRIVHVKEKHEDFDEFEERFRTQPVQLNLHPSLVHFAPFWRDRIASWQAGNKQTYLEKYGFTGPPTKHQPWERTSWLPDIPHHAIAQRWDWAWETVRKGYLYSAAPIPKFLHVTRESRQVLMESGYELTFRTRTHGPCTWFNFKTDILYPSQYECREYHFLTGHSAWDVGQYMPEDLKRIKRLALESGASYPENPYDDAPHEVSDVLELLPGVEELFLEDGGLCELQNETWPSKGNDSLWYYTPLLEIDVLSGLRGSRYGVYCAGEFCWFVKRYKQENMGDGSRYFVDTALALEQRLEERRDTKLKHTSLHSWRIPTVHIVYIGNSRVLHELYESRYRHWNIYLKEKDKQARGAAMEEALNSIAVPSRHITDKDDDTRPPSPFTVQYADDMEVLEEQWGYWAQEYDWEYEYPRRVGWFLEGTIAPPWEEVW
jgi:hypothetical protein